MRPSRRLLRLWLLWCGLLGFALLAGTGLPWWARAASLLALLTLARAGHRRYWRDPGAIRRLGWGRDGRWRVFDARGEQPGVAFEPPARAMGPLIWLAFRVAGRRKWVLIDATCAEPAALSALKARVRLLGS